MDGISVNYDLCTTRFKKKVSKWEIDITPNYREQYCST